MGSLVPEGYTRCTVLAVDQQGRPSLSAQRLSRGERVHFVLDPHFAENGVFAKRIEFKTQQGMGMGVSHKFMTG
jgi:hypothetical protein